MQKIIFRPTSKEAELYADKPKPAKNYIPDWFKLVPRFETKEMEINNTGVANLTMKACMPFLDTFTSGYIQEAWCDVYVDTTNPEGLIWRYPISPPILLNRGTKNMYPSIHGFNDNELAWQQIWIPQLPKGYSMLYTHPLNRFDLPFLSLTGIIDNDVYFMEQAANHPVFFRQGFKGIIPRGTPLFQMIPIKRDSWKSTFAEYKEEMKKITMEVRKHFYDGYKKIYWKKKDYS